MAKAISLSALDAALEYVADRASVMALCAGAPADGAAAQTPVSAGGKRLASVALTPGIGGEDFGLTDGNSGGRRLVVAAQAAVQAAEAGMIDHLALVDGATGELMALMELTEVQVVTAGEIVSVRSFGGEIVPPA